MMKYFLATCLALSIFIFISCAQTNNRDITVQRLNTYLFQLEQIGFKGSVLAGINDEIVLSKGYGFNNKEKQIKNSSNSIFDIGSITKQFTAAAILTLEMEGKLSTEDKLTKFFDAIPKDKENITIHDLLRHQSGLISNVGNDFEKISEVEFQNKVFSSALKFNPGIGFSYSNIGYSLLAMIIEKVSGQSYEDYLYKYLWKSARMEMTGYTRPQFDKHQIAVGYYRNDSIWGKPSDKEWDQTAPYWHLKGNGGILSTTGDLFKWHKELMTDNILSKEAKQKLYHPKLRSDETINDYYAYGWDVSKTSRHTTQVWHNGSNNILYADFLRFIDEGITLIMLSNQSHPNFVGLNFELARIIFNKSYIPEIPAADNETNQNFTNHIITITEDAGIEKAKEVYQKKNHKENLLVFRMRNEGFRLLDDKKSETAIRIFEMNVFAHPKSANALQDLGEGYMETGKNELALKYFRQSLLINPDNPFVSAMIKNLEDK